MLFGILGTAYNFRDGHKQLWKWIYRVLFAKTAAARWVELLIKSISESKWNCRPKLNVWQTNP